MRAVARPFPAGQGGDLTRHVGERQVPVRAGRGAHSADARLGERVAVLGDRLGDHVGVRAGRRVVARPARQERGARRPRLAGPGRQRERERDTARHRLPGGTDVAPVEDGARRRGQHLVPVVRQVVAGGVGGVNGDGRRVRAANEDVVAVGALAQVVDDGRQAGQRVGDVVAGRDRRQGRALHRPDRGRRRARVDARQDDGRVRVPTTSHEGGRPDAQALPGRQVLVLADADQVVDLGHEGHVLGGQRRVHRQDLVQRVPALLANGDGFPTGARRHRMQLAADQDARPVAQPPDVVRRVRRDVVGVVADANGRFGRGDGRPSHGTLAGPFGALPIRHGVAIQDRFAEDDLAGSDRDRQAPSPGRHGTLRHEQDDGRRRHGDVGAVHVAQRRASRVATEVRQVPDVVVGFVPDERRGRAGGYDGRQADLQDRPVELEQG